MMNFDWLGLLASLPSPTGPGVGMSLMTALLSGARYLWTLHTQAAASTSKSKDDGKSSLIERAIKEGVDVVLGNKAGKDKPLAFGGRDVTDALRHAQDLLRDWGVTIDSEMLKSKVKARLGQLLAGKLGLPVPAVATASPPA